MRVDDPHTHLEISTDPDIMHQLRFVAKTKPKDTRTLDWMLQNEDDLIGQHVRVSTGETPDLPIAVPSMWFEAPLPIKAKL